MSTGWLGGLNEALNKRLCRFLINRYLGALLKTKVTLEQLTVDLYNGHGNISDVAIDSEAVNEKLAAAQCPVQLVDGYIGEMRIFIPWHNLMAESCTLNIHKLQLLVKPCPSASAAGLGSQGDMINSMVESVIHSMASSMELARSVIMDDEQEGAATVSKGDANSGVDHLAQIIDAILSRMSVVLHETTLRIEYGGSIAHALEATIERVEMLDKQLQVACAEGTSMTNITVQPKSLNAAPNINKVLYVSGVKLYTDTFTRPNASILDNGSICSSMYLRRQKKSMSGEGTTDFQSCYSTLPPDLSVYFQHNSAPNANSSTSSPSADVSKSSSATPPNYELTEPVLFGELVGSKQTIEVLVESQPTVQRANGHKAKIEIKISMGSLLALVTPAQLSIIINTFCELLQRMNEVPSAASSKNTVRAMGDADFDRIETLISDNAPVARRGGNALSSHNASSQWSAPGAHEQFYATSAHAQPSRIVDETRFTDISIQDDHVPMEHTRQQTAPTLTPLTGCRSFSHTTQRTVAHADDDLTRSLRIEARFVSIWVAVMLDAEEKGNEQSAQQRAENFFAAARQVGIASASRFGNMRSERDNVLTEHQLRLLTGTVFVLLNEECRQDRTHLTGRVTLASAELIELLPRRAADDSVVFDRSPLMTFDPPEFDENGERTLKEADISIEVNNFEEPHHYKIVATLNSCRCDIDYSFVDRLYDFLEALSSMSTRDVDMLTMPRAPINSIETAFTIDVRTPLVRANIRVPVADCRPVHERPSYRERRIHDEYIALSMHNTQLLLDRISASSLAVRAVLSVRCNQATGGDIGQIELYDAIVAYLCGVEEHVGETLTTYDEVPFAHASNGCSFTVTLDTRDRTLRQQSCGLFEPTSVIAQSMHRSVWQSYYQQAPNGNKEQSEHETRRAHILRGPFSTRKQHYEDREDVTLVADSEELRQYRNVCSETTNVLLEINLGILRVYLPSPKFYEILYNRLANDLALYAPYAREYNAFLNKNTFGDSCAHQTPQQQFHPCTSIYAVPIGGIEPPDEDSDTDEDKDTLTNSCDPSTDRMCTQSAAISSDLALFVSCKSVNALLDTGESNKARAEEDEQSQRHQLAINGDNFELFVVAGLGNKARTTCFYTTVNTATLAHSFERRLSSDCTTARFARDYRRGDVMLCIDNSELRRHAAGDNVAVSLKIEHDEVRDTKEVCIAIALRNSCASISDTHTFGLLPSNDMWLQRLIDFFNAVDYDVLGYHLPRLVTQFTFQMQNVHVQYVFEHVASRITCRLSVDDARISSRLAAHFSRLRLECILEDLRVYLTKTPLEVDRAHFEDQHTPSAHYVCVAAMGLFDFELSLAVSLWDPSVKTPLDEIGAISARANNDALHLYLCADTLATLSFVVQQLGERLSACTRQESEENESVKDGAICDDEQPTTSDDHENVTLNQQLQAMVKSAMGDDAIIPDNKIFEPSEGAPQIDLTDLVASDLGDTTRPAPSQSAMPKRDSVSDDDDSFCIIDEIPGSGVTATRTTEPRIRWLTEESINVNETHFRQPGARSDVLTTRPPQYPVPLWRCMLRDITLHVHIYGGADFDDAVPRRAYSVEAAIDPLARHASQRVETENPGIARDHSVQVELSISKLSFLFELYAKAPAVSRTMLFVQDIEVLNRLRISRLHKILHQYSSEMQPKRTCAPIVSIRLLETAPLEYKCSVSALPLKVNMDQDTFEFMRDFVADYAAVLNGGRFADDTRTAAQHAGTSEIVCSDATEHTLSVGTASAPTTLSATAQTSAGAADTTEQQVEDAMRDSTATLDLLFNKPAAVSLGESVRFNKEAAEKDEEQSETVAKIPRETSSAKELTKLSAEDWREAVSAARRQGRPYIYSLSFAPSCPIRIDYEGSARVGSLMDLGTLQAVFLALTQLNCTHIELKALQYHRGLLGFDRCIEHLFNEWSTDIRRRQLPAVVGSVGPLSAVSQLLLPLRIALLGVSLIGECCTGELLRSELSLILHYSSPAVAGIRDLFVMPFEEYSRGTEGRLVKGVQRGAVSFGTSSASAVVQLTQNFVALIQSVAELAYDLSAPTVQYRRSLMSAQQLPATDFRTGLYMAAREIRAGVRDEYEQLQAAAAEERALGRHPLRGVLRHATPAALRPIVLAGRASTRVLQAMQVQLQPEQRHMIADKYKGTK